jgi:hypothetical protein
MKNLDLRGAGAVFRYTVQQHYKNRSVIIFLLFLFLGSLAVFPIRALVGGKAVTETAIKKVYLRNETGFMIEADDIRKDQVFSGVEIIETKDQLNPYEYMRNAQEQARNGWRYGGRWTAGQDYHQPETPLNREALKAWKRTPEGKKHGFSIEDGPQRIGVSARYALDFMTIYPKALVFVAGPLDPIIFADPETLDPAGMIMPVNPSALLPRK